MCAQPRHAVVCSPSVDKLSNNRHWQLLDLVGLQHGSGGAEAHPL